MPEELIIFLTAMAPVSELRASIPIGLVRFDQPWWLVLLLSVTGNLVPVPILTLVLQRAGKWMERMPYPIGPLLRWRVHHLQRRYEGAVKRYGPVVITLVVAIPLPLSGAWTGALLAWALQVPPRQSIVAIGAGVLIAGILVTALSVAGVELFIHLDGVRRVRYAWTG